MSVNRLFSWYDMIIHGNRLGFFRATRAKFPIQLDQLDFPSDVARQVEIDAEFLSGGIGFEARFNGSIRWLDPPREFEHWTTPANLHMCFSLNDLQEHPWRSD